MVSKCHSFFSVEHIGPKWVADFLERTDREDREITIRRVYEKVSEFLDMLNIHKWES